MTKKYISIFIILYHVLLSAPAYSKDLSDNSNDKNSSTENKEVLWEDRDYSKIQEVREGDLSYFLIENHTFIRTTYWQSSNNKHYFIIISQKTGNIVDHPLDLYKPYIHSSAYLPGNPNQCLWTIEEKADSGSIIRSGSYYDLYLTEWGGCCSAYPFRRLRNLLTGKVVMDYTSELLTITIPNSTLERFIGYKGFETLDIYPWENDKKFIGMLTYSSQNEILHRILFKKKIITPHFYDNRFGDGFAKISLESNHPKHRMKFNQTSLTLWNANRSTDPKKFTDIKINIQFKDAQLTIPIINDDFLFEKTEYSDFIIERIK